MNNEKLVQKGAEKRAQAGGNDFDNSNSGSGGYGGDNSNY